MPCPTFPTFDIPNEVKLGRFNARMTPLELGVFVIGAPLLSGVAIGLLTDTFEWGLVSFVGTIVLGVLFLRLLKDNFGPHYLFEVFIRIGIQGDGHGIISCRKTMRVLTAEPVPSKTTYRGGIRDLGMIEPIDRHFPPGGFRPAIPLRRNRQRDPGACIGQRMGGDAIQRFMAQRKRGG